MPRKGNRFKSLGKKKCSGRRQAGRLLPSWRTANARAGEKSQLSPSPRLLFSCAAVPSAAPPHPRRRPDPLAPAPTMKPPFGRETKRGGWRKAPPFSPNCHRRPFKSNFAKQLHQRPPAERHEPHIPAPPAGLGWCGDPIQSRRRTRSVFAKKKEGGKKKKGGRWRLKKTQARKSGA